jgi:hypothetical protein
MRFEIIFCNEKHDTQFNKLLLLPQRQIPQASIKFSGKHKVSSMVKVRLKISFVERGRVLISGYRCKG